MRNRYYIIFFMLLSCTVMTIATVYPHHHHDDRICLLADRQATNGTSGKCDGSCSISNFNIRIPGKQQIKKHKQTKEKNTLAHCVTMHADVYDNPAICRAGTISDIIIPAYGTRITSQSTTGLTLRAPPVSVQTRK